MGQERGRKRRKDLMLRLISTVTVAVTFIMLTSIANAQLDPSSALLLQGQRGGQGPQVHREGGLDSGRYSVKQKNEITVREPKVIAPKVRTTPEVSPSLKTQVDAVTVESKQEAVVEVVKTPVVESAPAPTPAPVAEEPKIQAVQPQRPNIIVLPVLTPTSPIKEAKVPEPTPEPAHRHKLLEVGVAPSYVYTGSDSGYYFRSYSSAAPAIGLEAKAWLTPTFALQASLLNTLSGHVSDSFNGARNVSASQQWLTAGLRFRRYFGDGILSPRITLGLDFHEYQFRVPTDAALRARVRSSGALITMEAELPATKNRSWSIGFNVGPRLAHQESGSVSEFQSGTSVDANLVGLSFGGKYQLAQDDAIFWRISHSVEKDLFSGDATRPDPLTGTTPSGVSVTNSFSIFQLGYIWGD